MHRIDGPGAVNRQFSEGDPAVPQMATVVTSAWLNDIQGNLAAVIEAAGIELVKGDYDQLRQAIALLATDAGGPHAALAYPTVCTTDHRAGVTGQAGISGGRVSVPAGVPVVLGQDTGNGLGIMANLATAAWQSAELTANSVYYVRGQVAVNGSLLLYVATGSDGDAIPGTLKGVPNGGGGGFDSTPLDVLLAKVATGGAGTVPAVTNLANAALLTCEAMRIPSGSYVISVSNGFTISDSLSLLWARTPRIAAVSGYVGVTTSAPELYMGGSANVISSKSVNRNSISVIINTDYYGSNFNGTFQAGSQLYYSILA